MGMCSRLVAGLLASMLVLGGGAALAQEATPEMGEIVTVDITNPDGDLVGTASFAETPEGVTITVQSTSEGDGSGIEPGLHGIHIHETGACDPAGDMPYASAGGHFNPTGAPHGAPDDPESHAGDLGNLEVIEGGTFGLEITTNKVTLAPGAENSLADEDGSAILIHANEDDLATDPSGESGGRIACGVIFLAAGAEGTPAADGSDATPEATPIG
jgi:superoxide dismutase, Cu-Zn family